MKPIPASALEAAKRDIHRRIAQPLVKEATAEDTLAFQLKQVKAPLFERQFRITPERKFKADFYFPVGRVVVEVEGGGYINGRHSRGAGMESDAEKSALIAQMPARLIRVTPSQVKKGLALDWILKALST